MKTPLRHIHIDRTDPAGSVLLYPEYADTICEINVGRLYHNIDILEEIAGGKDKVTAVLKANAYGHGAVPLMGYLLDYGVTRYAVANLWEALELRGSHREGRIHVLGRTPDTGLKLAAENDVAVSVSELDQVMRMKETGAVAEFYIKVDTGMHRFGLPCDETGVAEAAAMAEAGGERCLGVFSHLAQKDEDSDREQDRRFRWFLREWEAAAGRVVEPAVKVGPAVKSGAGPAAEAHILESHTALRYPDLTYSAVRAGAVLYGYGDHPDLLPVMTLRSRVCAMRRVEGGEGVGYGLRDRADHSRWIAVLPVGYADGIPSALGHGKGFVTICGKRAPYVGGLSMDSSLVDVTGIQGVKPGTPVTVFGTGSRDMTFVKAAQLSGRMRPELQAGLARRIPRVYETERRR